MTETRTNTLYITTPEGITFGYHIAGPVTRFLAWAIDLAAVGVIMMVLSLAASLTAVLSGDAALSIMTVSYFVVTIGYSMAAEWLWRGQTLGKRFMRLRVVDVQGLSLQFSQVALRNLLRALDLLPLFYFIGGVTSVLNRYNQRLGDMAANTVVINLPRILEPELGQLAPGKYNSFHDYPHLEGRLRQRVSPQEAAIAIEALVRRNELDPQARVELFRDLADHFRQTVPFPEEAVRGVSDEQYIRNTVETIFQGSKTPAG